jgi:hypothetical protein
MTPFQHGLSLINHGLVVLPVGPDKKPLTKWAEYQTERPTVNTYRGWSERFKNANPAVITGRLSGCVVFDIDTESFFHQMHEKGLPATPISKTPRGFHIWYRHPGYPIPNSANRSLSVDFRGDGGYVVAPPAVSPDGVYAWVNHIDEYAFDPLPGWVIDLFPTMKAKLAQPTMRGEVF